jgi:hypothetical protein
MVTRLHAGRTRNCSSIPGRGYIYFCTSRDSNQPTNTAMLPRNAYPAMFSTALNCKGLNPTTHIHPVPNLKKIWRCTSTHS